jgi:hypothetical protein
MGQTVPCGSKWFRSKCSHSRARQKVSIEQPSIGHAREAMSTAAMAQCKWLLAIQPWIVDISQFAFSAPVTLSLNIVTTESERLVSDHSFHFPNQAICSFIKLIRALKAPRRKTIVARVISNRHGSRENKASSYGMSTVTASSSDANGQGWSTCVLFISTHGRSESNVHLSIMFPYTFDLR